MVICYFGDYDPEYARNKVIIKGLKENNVEVVSCQSDFKSLKKFWSLYRQHKKLKGNYDFMIVGYSDSRLMVPLAKFISNKKIIWDAFYSLYDTMIYDRKLSSTKSLKVKYYWFLDWLNCRLSDKIILDTKEHIKYFIKEFKEKNSKFIKVLVGTDFEIFPPKALKKNSILTVGFWGKYIPLQGVEYIIKAAKILEADREIKFKVIGSGQESGRIKKLASDLIINNVEFLPKVPCARLPDLIADFDICLGIFGNTPKTQRVIPNKVYQAAAMGKAIITADTTAIRELFTNGKDILLCQHAHAVDLAEKIIFLKNHNDIRELMGNDALVLSNNKTKPKIIVQPLLQDCLL